MLGSQEVKLIITLLLINQAGEEFSSISRRELSSQFYYISDGVEVGVVLGWSELSSQFYYISDGDVGCIRVE